MAKDRKISLPRFLGWFTVPGEPENGRSVWYSIRFWNIQYSVLSGGSLIIRGAAVIRKQKQFFGIRWTVWKFTDGSTGLSGPTVGGYKSDLATKALGEGIVLDRQFFAEVCREAEKHFADLQHQIADAYSPRPRLFKVA